MLKAKYYPWVLIIIFSLIFGMQVDFWCGLAVGYMWHYGLLSKCAIGVPKATEWETSFPFKYWVDKEYFAKAGAGMGGSVENTGPVGSVLNRNGASSNFPAPGGSGPAAANSSAASFKSFSGKGVSLGGGSSAPSATAISSVLARNNASASRGRSTAETRADGEKERPRNLAHESKLVINSNRSNTTTSNGTLATDVDDLEGHPVDPQDKKKKKSDDKSGPDYQNLTTDSNNSQEE